MHAWTSETAKIQALCIPNTGFRIIPVSIGRTSSFSVIRLRKKTNVNAGIITQFSNFDMKFKFEFVGMIELG